MTFRALSVVLLIALATTAILGQAPQRSEPTFRVQVDAVEFDAFATDAQGNPITNLTVDDFEVLEDGKAQTITSFALVNIPIERPDRPLVAPAPIEPDVQINDRDEGRVYVIALDEVSGEQALRTRRFLHRFFERYFAENDIGAVVFLGRTNTANTQDFTGSRRLLLQAVDTFTGGFPDGPAAAAPAPAGAPAAVAAPSPGGATPLPSPGLVPLNQEATFALRRSMTSFRSIVEFMAGVHGRRKALLLFSEGYPIDVFRVMDYRGGVLSLQEEDLHKAVTAATRNNVAIYPIDPRGLTADGGLGENETSAAADLGERQTASITGMEARQSLRALAQATGGFAVVNTNSFESAWDRIVRENSSYYVLGYSSTNEQRDGRFRRIQVRVKRPGVQIRGRNGYVAPLRNERPAPPQPVPVNMSAGLAAALRSPLAVTGLPLRVFAAPYKGEGREATVAIAVEVDASKLNLEKQGEVYTGVLEVSFSSIDRRNKIFPGQTFTSKLSLKPDTYARALQGGLRVLTETRLAPGRYQLRVAASNRSTLSGSVVYDLTVPDFGKEPLTMSGVSLTSVVSAEALTMASQNPLANALPGPVTSTRDFASGDTLGLYTEVYEGSGSTSTHTVDLTAELRGEDGRVLVRRTEQRSSKELLGKSGGYGFTATLPLTDVEAGTYIIHVEARSSVGARPAVSREILIRIR
jgi:VWFA-related protein